MRRTNDAPKRAASGARGRSSTSATCLRPTCASAVTVSLSRRSAARGRGAIAFLSSPDECHDRRADVVPRHSPRAPDRSGDRGARLQPARPKPPHEIARERLLAAEQMRAAGDVEQQAVRRIEPDQRRIAVAPVGDRFEQREIRALVGLHDRDRRMHRARIRERHAGAQAERRRGVVHGREPQRAFDRGGDDQRFIRCEAFRDPVGRDPPQPHREIAPRRRAHDDPR